MQTYKIKSILRFFLHIFWIFPVNKRKLFFSSFKGSTISCSPFYICEEFQKKYNDYKIIWCSNNIEHRKLLTNYGNIKFVKFNSFLYIFHLFTSKILINNASFPTWIPFRNKKQIIINTWHGGGAYKKIGASESNSINIQKREMQSSKDTKYFISSSKMFTDVMKKSTFVSEEKFLQIGLPRNDIFFNSEKILTTKQKVFQELSLSQHNFIILYAPTYRGSSLNSDVPENNLNISKLKNAIKSHFKKNAFVLFRGHYFNNYDEINNFDLNVSNYPNMQELLCSVDMLITDYSSSMWDFSFTKKPCILYCTDLEKYKNERGFYTEPEKWGFPIAQSNDELEKIIFDFDNSKYLKAVEENHKYFGSYENGNATKKIIEIISNELKK